MTSQRLRNANNGAKSRKPEDDSDRRIEIRDKARDIFVRYGYRKTTIEDIGKACGLGKAALYHYFSSKEEIFAEVVRVECMNMLVHISAAVNAADGPKAKLVAMIKTRFKIIGEIMDEIIGRDLAEELDELLPLAAKARELFFEAEARILQQILEDGRRQGVFKKVPSSSVPLLIIAAFRGVEFHFAEVHDAPSLEEGMDSMLELFFEGLCQ